MKRLVFIYNYFIYRLRAINEHGVHSPFVYDLLTNVIYNRNRYYCFKKIKNVREQFLQSKKTICINETYWDTLSGSNNECISACSKGKTNTIEKKAWQLAKQITIPPVYSQLLFRLTNHFQPSKIIELGTSLGFHTAYLAAAGSEIDVITLEENKEIADIIKQNYKQLKLKNIEQKTGRIDTVLAEVLTGCPTLNFVLFNGNHCKQETLNHFHLCLEKANDASIFVFEGMNTSPEMKKAWNEIKNNALVTVTLDLFYLKIVFFRKEQVKQHFLIKF